LVWCDDPPEDRVISIVAGCLANHDRAHSPVLTQFTRREEFLTSHIKKKKKFPCLQTQCSRIGNETPNMRGNETPKIRSSSQYMIA
jgi:hypothetical protein